MNKLLLLGYIDLLRLNKPVGIYLLLWPTAWALLVAAQGSADWTINIIFIIGVVVMRSAGCVINDYADRHIDHKVNRTKTRPLVDGRLTEGHALIAFFILTLLALLLVLQLNLNTILLAFGGLLLTLIYPFTKRWFWYPQFFLGLAFSWAIPMAFMAYQQELPWACWALYFLNLLWVVAYDTIYALGDLEEDIVAGIKSTARLFGTFAHYAVITLLVFFLLGFAVFAWQQNVNSLFIPFWIFAWVLFAHQIRLMLCRTPEKYLQAFKDSHWMGLSLLIGLLVSTQ